RRGSEGSSSSQDFDVISAMEWTNGIATLPGSSIKFCMNEIGALEVLEEGRASGSSAAAAAQKTGYCQTTVFATDSEMFSIMDSVLVQNSQHCTKIQAGGGGSRLAEGGGVGRVNASVIERLNKKRKIGRRKLSVLLKCEPNDKPNWSARFCESLSKDRSPRMVKMKCNTILRKQYRIIPTGRSNNICWCQQLAKSRKEDWSWDTYIKAEQAIAAPLKLFTEYCSVREQCQTFPTSSNGFQVGMRLEGADPQHPSLHCVLSVTEVLGYRLRLHFDGYLENYDFWVNANSLEIHPAGWCNTTGHRLLPPKGYSEEEFSWPAYLKVCKAQAAPKHLFKGQSRPATTHSFEEGAKLEAVDRKNPSLVCVASVADHADSRFLVHFDNWDDTYDYWCDATSPYIHPVGWCQRNDVPLTPPLGHPEDREFSWEIYLEEMGADPVPARVFKPRPPHGFRIGMKIEVVDRRNPVLIRAASVAATDDHHIKVRFDGWKALYDYWLEADSPDIHPVGWCSRTGHPLQPPIGTKDVSVLPGPNDCPTPGCTGVGHIRGAKYSGHHSAFGCPYSEMNLTKDWANPDRLGLERAALTTASLSRGKRSDSLGDSCSAGIPKENPRSHGDDIKNMHCLHQWSEISCPCVPRLAELDAGILQQSMFLSALSPNPARSLPLFWEQHCQILPQVAGITACHVSKWGVDEVAKFISALPGCDEQAKFFQNEQIDGPAFLLLTQCDLVKIMAIKLGPALKIYNSILMFQNADSRTEL
uniref:L3MBTL histone methyl-lysine binding protein 1b n=1 Tax=Petromyzon marinus TaxID=7757 RepID=S4RBD1_PETMA